MTIIDVLEHLTEPKVILENLNKSLAKDGFLYIKVPNGPMQIIKQNIANFLKASNIGMFANFGHLNHFNVKSLKRVLAETNFSVEKISMARSEAWDDSISFHKLRNLFRSCYFHFSNLVYKVFGLPIGLNLVFMAKKK